MDLCLAGSLGRPGRRDDSPVPLPGGGASGKTIGGSEDSTGSCSAPKPSAVFAAREGGRAALVSAVAIVTAAQAARCTVTLLLDVRRQPVCAAGQWSAGR
jgi:hypothetical protein